jgi:kynurenine--oxoglutarate transaminase/cysteine-S-conjugate beta-lyase/glutamine--phenylpyruvate transaminase/kynurenine aminotransferase
MRDFALKLERNRNILLEKLLNTSFDFDLWVPKGGYFVVADISRIPVKEKYLTDSQGKARSRDYAFAYQLAL